MKVKVFQKVDSQELEKSINDWLENLSEDLEVFETFMSQDGTRVLFTYGKISYSVNSSCRVPIGY